MKIKYTLLSVIAGLLLMNCENHRYIEAGVNWSDDSQFQAQGNWYLALSEGCYSNCEGAVIDVADQVPIIAGEKAVVHFVLGAGSAGNVTAFVYLDVNANGVYDDGYDKITGYKFNYVNDSETANIAVPAYF